MSNQVLALKYRPRRFEDLIGQDSISTTLSLALDSNRLSHAYLFSGLRGSGKTSTARIMAKALVCKNAPTSKPCEECDGCKAANDYRHMDIIEMDAASNRGIDDIKDLIEHTKYKPTSANYKVFIIDEVHMLTTQAFNALLKTLEEPPPFVKFILATTDPLKLPATILSRTQHFRFKKISDKNVLHHLTHILNLENIKYEKEALEILIRSGQGSLRDTLTLLDQAIIYSKGEVNTNAVTDMMGMIDPEFMDRMFEIIVHNGNLNVILHELESYEAGQVIDEISIYLKQKMLLKDLRFDTYMFDRFFRILGDAKQLLTLNSDGGFVLILTLAKLAEATQFKSIDDVIAEVQNTPTTQEKTIQNNVVLEVKEDITVSPTLMEEKSIEETSEPISVQESVEQLSVVQEEPVFIEPIMNETEIKPEPLVINQQLEEISVEEKVETNLVQESSPQEHEFENPFMPDNFAPPFEQPEVQIEPEAKIEVGVNTEIKEIVPEPQTIVQKEIQEQVSVSPELNPLPIEETKIHNEEHLDMYAEVEGLVFDRSYELGEAFAESFLFNSFENGILTIDSQANDETRKLLHKNFAYIRAYIEDIFGKDTEIKFNKLPSKELPQSNIIETPIQAANDNNVGSMVEDKLQGGSGCVATMGASSNPTLAQQEMTINDVLNSKMVQKTIELFQPESQIRVKNKI